MTLLGADSPVPSTERFGFAILIQAGDMSYTWWMSAVAQPSASPRLVWKRASSPASWLMARKVWAADGELAMETTGISGKVDGITDEEMIARTQENFDGDVVLGEDLMVFSLADDGIEVLDQQALSER